MVVMIFAMYLFPNTEYNLYVYPYFIGGFMYHQYENSIKKYIGKKVEIIVFLTFFIMLFFYKEKHYIYTTGISLITNERSIGTQLGIDIFRYFIGFFGSLSVIMIIKNWGNRLPEVVKRILILCGKKSLEIYILQCMMVSWMFSMFYTNFVLNVTGWSLKNIFVIDFLAGPSLTIVFGLVIWAMLKVLNRIGKLNKILFGR